MMRKNLEALLVFVGLASFLFLQCLESENNSQKATGNSSQPKETSFPSTFNSPPLIKLSEKELKLLKQLTEEADSIIIGKVLKKESSWNRAKTQIFTSVLISVEHQIKGTSQKKELKVRIPGGTVDNITEWASHSPNFEVGERVLLFLKPAYCDVVKWDQGKFTIKDNKIAGLGIPLYDFVAQIKSFLNESQRDQVRKKKSQLALDFPEPVKMQLENNINPPKIDQRLKNNLKMEKQLGWQILFKEDFENSQKGPSWLNFKDTEFNWGFNYDRAHSGKGSAYCANGDKNIIQSTTKYVENMNSLMIYGPFDLSEAKSAEVSFWYWNSSESDFDYLKWLVSVDGINFYGYQVSGDSRGWQQISFDLANVPEIGNVCGQSSVWLAFVFTSDESNNYEGAYLDDIILRANSEPLPVITNITPASGSAGTNTLVTISGDNFGESQGMSVVKFYNDKIAYCPSWSNNTLICEIPREASSGEVSVTTSAGTSNGYPFTVTFSYLGRKWPEPAMGENYLVNENTSDCEGELSAIQASAETWCATGADFCFSYGGPTKATDYGYNGENEIMWVDYYTGAIAITFIWFSGEKILECDMIFDDNYNWSTSGAPSDTEMDVQNIATHEFGHFLSLGDLYGSADSEKTMYGYGALGETKKRSLEPEDLDGIFWIYGAWTPRAEICNGVDDDCNGVIDDGGDALCDDGNICTDDFCYGIIGCSHRANSVACDDGLWCNGADSCGGGSCRVHQYSGSERCQDGLYCNGFEICNEALDICEPGTPPDCDDNNICTDDICNEISDRCDHINNSNPCDDNSECTENDLCSGGICAGTWLADGTACGVGGECLAGVCENCAYRVLSPNGGEQWISGTRHKIRWKSYGSYCSEYVKIKLSTQGVKGPYRTIKKRTANDGVLSWLIPDAPSKRARIKIVDDANKSYYDLSDRNFTILSNSDSASVLSSARELEAEEIFSESEAGDRKAETEEIFELEEGAGEERFGCMMIEGEKDSGAIWSMAGFYLLPLVWWILGRRKKDAGVR